MKEGLARIIWLNHLATVLVAAVAGGLIGCRSDTDQPRWQTYLDELPAKPERTGPYAPELSAIEPWPVGGTITAYWFSESQLSRMAKTKIDARRFINFIEREWPVAELQKYCVKSNRWPKGYQNLVPLSRPVDVEIHEGVRHGFDSIRVYVSEDNGKGKYMGRAGWNWHRWKYSLNVPRKRNHWAIIDVLPNDFMDSSAYEVDEPAGSSATGSSNGPWR